MVAATLDGKPVTHVIVLAKPYAGVNCWRACSLEQAQTLADTLSKAGAIIQRIMKA